MTPTERSGKDSSASLSSSTREFVENNKQGADVWNALKRQDVYRHIDLSGVDLSRRFRKFWPLLN
jgi:hypothetical protein